MARKTHPWYRDLASLMIRDRISFRAGLAQLGIAVSGDEATAIECSRGFKKVLDEEQAVIYQEFAQSPNFDKNTVVGGMLFAIKQLIREGEFDKALEGWFKLARVQNWVGAGEAVNLVLGISQKDIDERLEALKKQEQTIH